MKNDWLRYIPWQMWVRNPRNVMGEERADYGAGIVAALERLFP